MPENNRKLRVFLCHASQDKPVVRELYQRLLAEGWIEPWLDEEKLLPGQDWDMEIEKAVEASHAVIVCLSGNSVKKEGYIQKELRFALNLALEKPEEIIFVIPLRLDDCFVPRSIRSLHYIDYFPLSKRDAVYKRVLASLLARAEMLGGIDTKLHASTTKRVNNDLALNAREETQSREYIDINKIVDNAIVHAQDLPQNRMKNIRLQKKLANYLPTLEVDREKIQSSLYSFLESSFAVADENGIITVTTRLGNIERNRALVIEITVVGKVLSETEMSVLFDPSRLSAANKTSGGELWFAKSYIADQLNGVIEIWGNDVDGTTFTIMIPTGEKL